VRSCIVLWRSWGPLQLDSPSRLSLLLGARAGTGLACTACDARESCEGRRGERGCDGGRDVGEMCGGVGNLDRVCSSGD